MLEVKRDDFDESLEDIMVSIDEILKSTKEGYEVEKEENIKAKNVTEVTFFYFGTDGGTTRTRVTKIVHRTIFTFASAGSRSARSLACSFSSPTF